MAGWIVVGMLGVLAGWMFVAANYRSGAVAAPERIGARRQPVPAPALHTALRRLLASVTSAGLGQVSHVRFAVARKRAMP